MTQALVEAESLKFRWRPELPLVLDVSKISVSKGESVFIYGPSGSGKSTLLNLLGGVLQTAEGNLHVLGQNFSKLSAKDRDHLRGDQMGFIFQQFNLMPYLSVIENILLPIRFSERKRQKLHQMGVKAEVEATRLLNHLKLNVDEVIQKPVAELSVGQQQRVAAARAMIGRPELIVADEPTSSLDAEARESFLRVLFSECREAGSTLIFVSHDRELGKLFDRQIDLKALNKAYLAVET